jgi:hypothetical protein
MSDPVTIGVLTASTLAMAAEAVFKSSVGEVVKDAYKALKDKVAIWIRTDVEALEKTPTSQTRQAVVARRSISNHLKIGPIYKSSSSP